MVRVSDLSELEKALYYAVNSGNGEWLSRTDIAQVLEVGPKSFGAHYWGILEYLADMNLIERKIEKRGIVMSSYFYRSKPEPMSLKEKVNLYGR